MVAGEVRLPHADAPVLHTHTVGFSLLAFSMCAKGSLLHHTTPTHPALQASKSVQTGSAPPLLCGVRAGGCAEGMVPLPPRVHPPHPSSAAEQG